MSSWTALTDHAANGGPSSSSGPASLSGTIYSYLERLPPSTLARLYASPSSTLAVFRLLPLAARHLVMNLLWIAVPIEAANIEIWFSRRSEGKRQLEAAINALRRLHVLEAEEVEAGLVLNANFQKSLKRALTGGGSHNSFGIQISPSSQDPTTAVTIPTLDAFAKTSWERMLHYLVGSEVSGSPSTRVLDMLKSTGLMSGQTQGRHGLRITSKGFQFLLKEVNAQLWDLLLDYLRRAEEGGGGDGQQQASKDVVEVLGGLFMLGSLELGKAYSMSNLTRTQKDLLNDLADYGLVYSVPGSSYFYPTRLATTLTSHAPPLVSHDEPAGAVPPQQQQQKDEQGYIILETNYRIYAYTSNPLQIAVLNLFITLKSRFPNLVIGQITRESIKSALSNGITSGQIITYLLTHAHPELRNKQNPILPTTVTDQIKLWELEKNRLSVPAVDGYLYEDFRTLSDYTLVFKYAQQLDCVLWSSEQQRKFYVTGEGHLILREFIKRRMAAAQAQAAQSAPSN